MASWGLLPCGKGEDCCELLGMQLDVKAGLARQQRWDAVDRLDDGQCHHARIEPAEFTGPLTSAQQLFEARDALGDCGRTYGQAAVGAARVHRDLNEGD